MLNWLFQEPIVGRVVVGAGIVVAVVVLLRLWQRRREAVALKRRRAELQHAYQHLQEQTRELGELAAQIIATGSTGVIAGFEVVRQIEAVFCEGQRSPSEAVEALKALAARKGANAVINLNGQRLPNGKCVASGDAVIVRPLASLAPDAPARELKRGNGDRGVDRRWD